jgi:phosphate-selective porin
MEPEVSASVSSGPPLAGWHGNFFLRDQNDYFRLYPKGRLHVDFNSFFGPGVNGENGVAAADDGNNLKNRLVLRRLRLEFAGEIMKRIQWNISAEFGGQPLSNANGKTQTSASSAGKDPGADSARWAAVQGATAVASIENAYINYSVCPCLNFQLGQYNSPISMENRTSSNITSWMERSLPIRSFVVPSNKELGLMVWGELGEKNLIYEVGVFAGDGLNRAQVDNAVDVMGRVAARPFAKKGGKSLIDKAQIGISARHGERDQAFVGYSYPSITTGQGVSLWTPRYNDAQGRRTHVIPSGSQNFIGGELRLPISKFELRGEGYYVANNTREALEGYQVTNTERFGRITGVGWYVQLSAWPIGDAFANGDPGIHRPTSMDLSKDPGKPKKGLEVVAIVGGVNADYNGASRGGSAYDEKTPGAPGVTSNVTVMQYGLGANYWYSKSFRASVNYILYQTPGSGADKENLASVPGNSSKVAETRDTAHTLHELGTRFAIMF